MLSTFLAAVALGLVTAAAPATRTAEQAQAQQPISHEVLFWPKWVCTRAPCGGDRLPFRSDRIAASALKVDAAHIITPAGAIDRRHVLRIRVGPASALSDIPENPSPEDMVIWRSGRRTFGDLRISDGLVRQAGQPQGPLSEARFIQFGKKATERVTDETLRIGQMRESQIPGVEGYEMERCWIEMLEEQKQRFERLRRELGPVPPGKALWAEFTAIRSLGRRYGPDGQYLCELKVTKFGKLRWTTARAE